jgi:ABC-type Fe3+ transport system permease subunit
MFSESPGKSPRTACTAAHGFAWYTCDVTEKHPGRLRSLIAALMYRAQAFTVVGYLGVASFIGVETLIVLLGFTTVLPIAIPFVLIALGLVYLFRQRLRGLWGGEAE